ncbi:hypothetical protein AB4259_18720 [Vibrio amylolyticus]|uniref:hypothetical protein n=1 Tax=Vibrio TaxID=662 RepID=UPI000C81DB58|nr:hypothetical protein [Vibrio sp. 10N.261.55.A7]PMK02132.1 hypothetical protein BCU12_18720 [Vibrio sp. 10N.261.55.A7]
MNIKLGHIMSSSRLVCFVAFLAAIFAWALSMPVLFIVSVLFLVVSAIIYISDLSKNRVKEKQA